MITLDCLVNETSAPAGDNEAAPPGVLQRHLRNEHRVTIEDLTAQMTRSCVVKSDGEVFLLTTTRSVQSAVALVSQHVQEETLDDQSRSLFLQMVKVLPSFQDKFTAANGHCPDSRRQFQTTRSVTQTRVMITK